MSQERYNKKKSKRPKNNKSFYDDDSYFDEHRKKKDFKLKKRFLKEEDYDIDNYNDYNEK